LGVSNWDAVRRHAELLMWTAVENMQISRRKFYVTENDKHPFEILG
jgi:hypothetical protein